MKALINKSLNIFIIAVLILISACGGGTGPGYDVRANLNQGWSMFASEDYTSAIDKFIEVLDHSTDNSEAYLGLGWSYAFDRNFTSAVSSLTSAVTQGQTTDAYMGLAAVYRDLPNYSAAISNADLVIQANPAYVFSRRTSIDYKDAYLIKAQCHFRLGTNYFTEAVDEINYLCSLMGISELPDPASLSAAEFELAMSSKLEQLGNLIGG